MSPFPASPIRQGSGPGREPAAAMMGLAGRGGVTRAAPCAGPAPLAPFFPSPAWALATTAPRYSRFVHQLPHLPHVQHGARAGRATASLSCSPRTPEHFRAGADPGRVAAAARRLDLPQSAPLATAAAPPVTRRDAGAEALRGAEVSDSPPTARGAQRDL